jgi:hypothetical protein
MNTYISVSNNAVITMIAVVTDENVPPLKVYYDGTEIQGLLLGEGINPVSGLGDDVFSATLPWSGGGVPFNILFDFVATDTVMMTESWPHLVVK